MDTPEPFTPSEMTGAGALVSPIEPSTLVPARLARKG